MLFLSREGNEPDKDNDSKLSTSSKSDITKRQGSISGVRGLDFLASPPDVESFLIARKILRPDFERTFLSMSPAFKNIEIFQLGNNEE